MFQRSVEALAAPDRGVHVFETFHIKSRTCTIHLQSKEDKASQDKDFGSKSLRGQNLNRRHATCSEELSFASNKDIGSKVFIEMACNDMFVLSSFSSVFFYIPYPRAALLAFAI